MLEIFDGMDPTRSTVRLLEEKCSAGVFAWTLQTGDMQLSDGAFSILGLPRSANPPDMHVFRSMMHPEDRIGDAELDNLIAAGLPFTSEFRIIQRDGRMRWLCAHVEFLLDTAGTPLKMLGVIIDVTQRHETAQVALVRQAQFHDLVMAIASVIWTADPDGMVTAAEGWENVTGKPESSALGYAWLDFVHPEDRRHVSQIWRASMARGRIFEQRLRLRQSDGSYRAYRVHATLNTDRTGVSQEWNGLTVETGAAESAGADNLEGAITGAQIRASRAILKWSVSDLSDASGVSSSVIRRLEDDAGEIRSRSGLTLVRASLDAVRNALEQSGIDFIFDASANPGVRPSATVKSEVPLPAAPQFPRLP